MSRQEEKRLAINFDINHLPSSVAIIGCGDLGTSIAGALAQAKTEVYGIRRSAGSKVLINWIQADVTRPLNQPLPAVEQVLFCIAPKHYTPEAYHQAYVQGLKNSLEALSEPPKHLWVVSSTGVFGDQAGLIDERTPIKPETPMNEAIAEMESIASNQPYSATVVRLGGIYGPGRTALIQRTQEGLDPGSLSEVWTNRIHRDDAARLVLYLMAKVARGEPVESLYLGVDDKPCLLSEVIQWLRTQLQIEHINPEIQIKRQSQKRISNQKIRQLGFELLFPTYQQGYAQLIRSLQMQSEKY
jgi:nucleoside-diphosphate-sugar epimerase